MGWRLDDLELLFADDAGNLLPAFDGCEVVARPVTIHELGEVLDLIGPAGLAPTVENIPRIVEIAGRVMGSVVRWNLEDEDGSATPVTVDGLLSHPKDVVMQVVNAWVSAQREGPRPFVEPSNGGAPLAEIPTQSLAS